MFLNEGIKDARGDGSWDPCVPTEWRKEEEGDVSIKLLKNSHSGCEVQKSESGA